MTYRPDPPGLIVQSPICPMCRERVSFDGDGYTCESCAAYWSSFNPEDSGTWHDPDEPRCTSTVDASKTGGGTYQCVKGESHADAIRQSQRKHRGENGATWPNSHLPEIVPARPSSVLAAAPTEVQP